jgi:hypothetical protein
MPQIIKEGHLSYPQQIKLENCHMTFKVVTKTWTADSGTIYLPSQKMLNKYSSNKYCFRKIFIFGLFKEIKF